MFSINNVETVLISEVGIHQCHLLVSDMLRNILKNKVLHLNFGNLMEIHVAWGNVVVKALRY